MAQGFKYSRSRPNPLHACIAALDGIVLRMKQPGKKYNPRDFYNRKGYFAFPVQAAVDSNYRFLTFSAMAMGCTHDSTAHAMSNLGEYLRNENLPGQFWIAGDEAYTLTESLLIPFSANMAPRGSFNDAFNFFHSSMRIHVEQAFGTFVNRWRIFHGALAFSVENIFAFIKAALLLHNFCMDARRSR